MSVDTHVNEYDAQYDMDGFLDNAIDRAETGDEVRKFLHKLYPSDDDDGKLEDETSYDMDKAVKDTKFVILCKDNSIADFYEENYLTIHLPSREKADELADILDGTVTEDHSADQGAKTFRITYRNEIYIKADSEEDAKTRFQNMPRKTLDKKSEFVELVSCEEDN